MTSAPVLNVNGRAASVQLSQPIDQAITHQIGHEGVEVI